MPYFRKTKNLKELRKQKVLKDIEEKKVSAIDEKISEKLDVNIGLVKDIMGGDESGDLIVRQFNIGGNEQFGAAIVYIDNMVDNDLIDNFILRSQMLQARDSRVDHPVTKDHLFEYIKKYSLTIDEIDEIEQMKKVMSSILNGDSVFFIDGSEKAFDLNTKGWEHRQVDEPQAEAVVRGPREGFTETLRTNTALLRIRLKDPNLRMKSLTVGKRTNTFVALAYIDGIVAPRLLDEIEKRIKNIDIDGILESGYIEQLIEDSHWSPFPTVQETERPDKAVANILEGKVVIIVDGTPFALIAPAVITQFLQSSEDYYQRFWISTIIRFFRFISMFITLLAPSLYVAFTAFHPEMIPNELLIAIAAGRATVPFPSFVEALIMLVTIEVLREASIRLPGLIGPTIGIVGALVIGDAAVAAGLVSPMMVIITSLTMLASFTSPSYSASIAIRLLSFPMMIMAAIFGLYGIMLFLMMIVLHLCALKSFGVPYLAPLTPANYADMKDVLFRAPLQWMVKRPKTMMTEDDTRQPTGKAGGENNG